mmetsp:Transcript_38152/g.109479  ORF Transcript_38152/g.109479 Transcript_38152/m.109479 type:complete len:530 (-) Transcript_38152:463-2052(-)
MARLYSCKASWWRLVQLLWYLLPLGFLWPLWLVNPFAFWTVVASQLERCGPCFVKLSQWLATRRDIFPDSICIAFGRLHEQVTAEWSPGVTPAEVLAQLQASGLHLRTLADSPQASGSIAEVYFGELEDGTAVAVKCMRPGIRPLIEGDLAWLLWAANVSDGHPVLRMYALRWAAELFCNQVYMQTDFRIEADNLRRFRANFRGDGEVIRFPRPLHASSDLLVLSREEGQELSRIFREADNAGASSSRCSAEARAEALHRHLGISKEMGGAIAKESIAVYMRMLFKDNFVHGDLHPGNILLRVRKPDGAAAGGASAAEDGLRGRLPAPLRFIADAILPPDPGFDLVLLDAGLAVPLPSEKVEILRSTTTAILYADYDKAARLAFSMSPDTTCCEDPQQFQRELADIFKASRQVVWDQGFLQLSDAGLMCLDLVRRHHVHLDATFSWAILALLSVEGAGRQLDPSVDATGAATRYLISVRNLIQECQGGSWISTKEMVTQLVFDKLGLDFWAFRNWRLAKWNEETHIKAV